LVKFGSLTSVMSEAGDKLVTNGGSGRAKRSKSRSRATSKKQGPFQKVKFGSAVVPIYRTESRGRVRFTLSFYRDGRGTRRSLPESKAILIKALRTTSEMVASDSAEGGTFCGDGPTDFRSSRNMKDVRDGPSPSRTSL